MVFQLNNSLHLPWFEFSKRSNRHFECLIAFRAITDARNAFRTAVPCFHDFYCSYCRHFQVLLPMIADRCIADRIKPAVPPIHRRIHRLTLSNADREPCCPGVALCTPHVGHPAGNALHESTAIRFDVRPTAAERTGFQVVHHYAHHPIVISQMKRTIIRALKMLTTM